MQFKYPEVLFFLFLLLIPLLIHLFQLQKFRKQAFTNVKFLKQIDLETRKSSRLKKLLILASRMLLMSALIFAFSQPFINNNPDLKERVTIIYIDNSMSMLAKGTSEIDLLEMSKNYLLDKVENLDQETTLITNQRIISNLDSRGLSKELLQLEAHPIKKSINQILLGINDLTKSKTNTSFDIYLISDFQGLKNPIDSSLIHEKFDYSLVDVSDSTIKNISLDTVWVAKEDPQKITIKAIVSSENEDRDNLSISLLLNQELFGKSTVNVQAGISETVEFVIPKSDLIQGKIALSDRSLVFDNELFFSIPKRPKKKILVVGKKDDFLSRIYRKEEFDLNQTTYNELDQSKITSQDLLILNAMDKIPNPLIQTLQSFVQNNGNLVIIPSMNPDIDSYNNLLNSMSAGFISGAFKTKKSINKINYDHPFFDGVFEKEIYNFDYPSVEGGFQTNLTNASTLLQFDDLSPFISEIKYTNNKIYWVSSSLSSAGNEFLSSPLIVPVFYNFVTQKANKNAIYLTIGQRNELYIKTASNTDQPLKIIQNDIEFIPEQIKTSNRVNIITNDHPVAPGLYELKLGDLTIEQLAYNFDRSENNLNPTDQEYLVNNFDNIHLYKSLDIALKEGNQRNNNKELWQLFIIFALVFLILEILLQKFLKN